jgi:histidyl-tRNA synthetase
MQTPRPMRGMRDMLPGEVEIRHRALDAIRETFRRHGFLEIETPIVETLESLEASGAGENEKLMFKLLKRGERLEAALEGQEAELTDAGLRFDLTVPLARFYAINQSKLPKPFYAMQIGPVFRAERPQKGRYRQFVQTDVDVLGDSSPMAEIQLLIAATAALHKLGIEGFEIHLNDRRVLEAVLDSLGVGRDLFVPVMIALDKLDKVQPQEVVAELEGRGLPGEHATRVVATLMELGDPESQLSLAKLGIDRGLATPLELIQHHVAESVRDVEVVFDPLTVRGLGYYTSTVYELVHPRWPGSLGGGGRYDDLIGRFGVESPACGISLGFERVVGLLEELGIGRGEGGRRLTVIFDPEQQIGAALSAARHFRREGYQVTLLAHPDGARSPMKRLALAAEELKSEGFDDSFYYLQIGRDEAPRLLMH